MMKRLTSLFLLVTLAGSVFAGMQMHFWNSGSNMAMMPCCKTAKTKTHQAKAANLCCAVNCTDPSPTAPTGSQFNFVQQLAVALHPSEIQTSSLFTSANSYLIKPTTLSQTFQPKYIQHHSFLI